MTKSNFVDKYYFMLLIFYLLLHRDYGDKKHRGINKSLLRKFLKSTIELSAIFSLLRRICL